MPGTPASYYYYNYQDLINAYYGSKNWTMPGTPVSYYYYNYQDLINAYYSSKRDGEGSQDKVIATEEICRSKLL